MSPLSSSPPDPRFFSLAEANRTLPLVRRIVEDLMEEYQAADRDADRLQSLVEELQELGCLFKGFDEGLVDWYSYYAGRAVYLCWRLGEPEIEWWHQLEGGFSGRQRILPSQRDAFRSDPEP